MSIPKWTLLVLEMNPMMMKNSAFMKEQIDCKNHTMHFLKRVENIQEWLRQPLER